MQVQLDTADGKHTLLYVEDSEGENLLVLSAKKGEVTLHVLADEVSTVSSPGLTTVSYKMKES